MKLSLLFENISNKIIGEDKEISSICFCCDEAKKGSLYFCLNLEDSEENCKKAILNGAVAVVCESDISVFASRVIVDDCRSCLSEISKRFYGYNNELKIIGVVGTNGKTSTCKMLSAILINAGKRVGTICTHEAKFEDYFQSTEMTTPDPVQLFEIITKMKEKGAQYIVMELSAHAIFFKKCSAINFSYLIFTNCSQDHLDFFKDYESYKQTKKSAFLLKNYQKAIVNSDDKCGVEILQKTEAITYGLNNPADVFAINIKERENCMEFVINAIDDIQTVKLNAIGLFNLYNFLSAVTVAKCEGIDMSSIVKTAEKLPKIEGRCELVGKFKGGSIYLDYAHTPQGLNNLLNCFKRVCRGRLICLFGCGGNRDKDKREKMGEISGKNSDFTIITTDNPRYEEPYQIIDQIEMGVRRFTRNYITIQNRKTAIEYGLNMLGKNDIFIVAGKGNEKYQEVMGTKHKFSDKEIIAEIIKENV